MASEPPRGRVDLVDEHCAVGAGVVLHQEIDACVLKTGGDGVDCVDRDLHDLGGKDVGDVPAVAALSEVGCFAEIDGLPPLGRDGRGAEPPHGPPQDAFGVGVDSQRMVPQVGDCRAGSRAWPR